MRFDKFIGPSYRTPAIQVDAQTSMNLYPELIAGDGGASETAVLVRTPGLKSLNFIGLAAGEGRGLICVKGRCFVVVADRLYELSATLLDTPNPVFSAQLRGTLTGGGTTGAVKIASNGVQLLILSNLGAWVYDLRAVSNPLTYVAPAGWNWSRYGLTVLDTYFVAVSTDPNQFMISAPLDGTSWSALDFSTTQEADLIVALEELHGYLWLFGNNCIIVYQDTGAASFPFQRVPGSKIEVGTEAPLSICKLDNSIFWLGSSTRGPAVVYRADGFLPSRISTHAVEAAIQSYSTVSDAIASTYEERGHLFYRLDFPTAGATWLYDVSTKAWHERGYWNTATGAYLIHPARFHGFWNGLHIALSAGGTIYQQSLTLYDDAGNPLRWLRRAPHIDDKAGRRNLFYRRFELITNTGFYPLPADPIVSLRWSNDGGVTWSSDLGAPMSSGQVGEYQKRVIWRQLGSARSRVFEVSGSDPVPDLVLIGAELRVEQGSS